MNISFSKTKDLNKDVRHASWLIAPVQHTVTQTETKGKEVPVLLKSGHKVTFVLLLQTTQLSFHLLGQHILTKSTPTQFKKNITFIFPQDKSFGREDKPDGAPLFGRIITFRGL